MPRAGWGGTYPLLHDHREQGRPRDSPAACAHLPGRVVAQTQGRSAGSRPLGLCADRPAHPRAQATAPHPTTVRGRPRRGRQHGRRGLRLSDIEVRRRARPVPAPVREALDRLTALSDGGQDRARARMVGGPGGRLLARPQRVDDDRPQGPPRGRTPPPPPHPAQAHPLHA